MGDWILLRFCLLLPVPGILAQACLQALGIANRAGECPGPCPHGGGILVGAKEIPLPIGRFIWVMCCEYNQLWAQPHQPLRAVPRGLPVAVGGQLFVPRGALGWNSGKPVTARLSPPATGGGVRQKLSPSPGRREEGHVEGGVS